MDTVNSELAEKVTDKTEPPSLLILPDDITRKILCSLPTQIIMICQLVCRRWRDLTLTHDFVNLHLQRSIPMILVANQSDGDLAFLDNWWESAQTSLRIRTFDYGFSEHRALFSHAGLIVFQRASLEGVQLFTIFNPVDQKNVRITLFESHGRSQIYGVFLHPLQKDYCSLWKIHTSKDDFQYKILSLGPDDPSFKPISYPFGRRSKRMDASPLLKDNFLYWMLDIEQRQVFEYGGRNDIMEYDIAREEFNIIPCPVPVDTECRYDHTLLLVIDGTLSFLRILPCGSLIRITIWRLENRAEQLWTSAKYKFLREIGPMYGVPRATVVVYGKLAFLSEKRICVGDLMQGSMRCLCKHEYVTSVLPHQMSFASLRNCKSTIVIKQDGEHVYAA